MIIGIIAFLVLAIVGGGLIFFSFSDTGYDGKGFKPAPFLSGLGIVLLALLSFGCTQSGPGHLGVVTSFGQVQEKTLARGLHYVVPVLNQVTTLDARVRSLRVEG